MFNYLKILLFSVVIVILLSACGASKESVDALNARVSALETASATQSDCCERNTVAIDRMFKKAMSK